MDSNPRNTWHHQRLSLEQGRFRSTPDGPLRKRKWAAFDPALMVFEQLLRLAGLHGRGLRNALNVSLKTVSFDLPNLPAPFNGYRILQISDPHLDMLPRLSERIVASLSGVSADLLLLTGDYRNRHDAAPEDGLAMLRPILAAVDAPDGKFAILGNHDPAAAVPILEDMGLTVLLNQSIAMERSGGILHLTGLDDVHSFYTDAAHRALREPIDGCRIAAVHSAEVADLAAAAGIDLYLCGHTHGGQIRLPWGRPPFSNLRRCRAYSHGQWQHGDMLGYTSNGAGVATIPIRYNCPPEVALITLRRPD